LPVKLPDQKIYGTFAAFESGRTFNTEQKTHVIILLINMNDNRNLIYHIGITLVKGIGNVSARKIVENLNDVSLLFIDKKRTLEHVPDLKPRIVDEIHNPAVLKRAEKEILFIEKNNITPLFINDPAYPQRLKNCHDAPVMLYYRGSADLNAERIISIVGTRNVTAYGRTTVERMVKDLAERLPDVIIVSGLAYGIDGIAHRAAIRENLETVGVLAHGLDRIYPAANHDLALKMLKQGGLLADFMSKTHIERGNFVQRNRIIAGLSDCTVVVESPAKGGSLITADLASSYGREVFAVPGRIGDGYSEGCNRLILRNEAHMMTSVDDLLKEMNWDLTVKKPDAGSVRNDSLPDVKDDERVVFDAISKAGSMHVNELSYKLDIPVSRLSNLLFELEFKGLIRSRPGGMFEKI
jgi:DNA processing protein